MKFLKPRVSSILLTIVVLFLPLIAERTAPPSGGLEIIHYSPIFLLSAYLQMKDYYPFFLMFCFSLLIYLVVSFLVLIVVKLFKLKR